MSKISCDVCMDLTPLVQDGIASLDSQLLVKEHLAECPHCAQLPITDPTYLSPTKSHTILIEIQKYTYMFATLLIGLGIFMGMNFSLAPDRIYNLILMPILGLLSFFVFRKNAYIILLITLILSFLQYFSIYVLGDLKEPVSLAQGLFYSFGYPTFYALLGGCGILLGYIIQKIFKSKTLKG